LLAARGFADRQKHAPLPLHSEGKQGLRGFEKCEADELSAKHLRKDSERLDFADEAGRQLPFLLRIVFAKLNSRIA